MTQNESVREQPSRALARLLREQIRAGELRPGDKLPSERTLATLHGVARNTAREAFRLLQDEGLVDVQHGSGAYVRTPSPLMRFGASRYSRSVRERTGLSPYRAEVEAQGKVPRVDCVGIERVPAPEFVAERLQLKPGSEVVRRENRYYADEEPTQIGVTYIPAEVAGNTVLANSAALGPGSLYARFAERGHEITWTREEISTRVPTPEEVALLDLPGGVALLDLIHTGIDQNGHPFEVTTFLMRGDITAVDYTIMIEK